MRFFTKMEYKQLLDKLYSEIKPVKISERFEVPQARCYAEGNKTMIMNFMQICSALRRDRKHIAKFLMRELAAPGVLEKDRLTLVRKLSLAAINNKISEYAKEFVICPQCKKPDTELIKEGRFLFLRCLACGAKHSVRTKI